MKGYLIGMIILVILLLIPYFLGVAMFWFKVLGIIFVLFGVLTFLLAGLLENAGPAGLINVGIILFIIGIILLLI